MGALIFLRLLGCSDEPFDFGILKLCLFSTCFGFVRLSVCLFECLSARVLSGSVLDPTFGILFLARSSFFCSNIRFFGKRLMYDYVFSI